MNIKGIWNAILNVQGAIGIVEFLKPWIFPFLSGAITVATAYVASIPIPYLLAAASIVFAMSAHGVFYIRSLREKIDPSGKLQIVSTPLYGVDVDTSSDQHILKNVQFGFSVLSKAEFPIFFSVDEIYSEFMGRVCQNKNHQPKVIEVPAGGEGWWRDFAIPIQTRMPNDTRFGKLTFKVSYWKNPRRTYSLQKKWSIQAAFNAAGSVHFSATEE